MIRNFTADYIFPITSEPIKNGIVSVDENGEIRGVYESGSELMEASAVERLSGIIVPGFVNSHCHLELSYLHKKIPPGGGLISFIKHVVTSKQNKIDEEELQVAMRQADKAMYENGIVAVGDIVNSDASLEVKKNSRIYYHTYVEVLGFSPTVAESAFEYGLRVQSQFDGLPASIVPHSPYSVSKSLFKLIKQRSEHHNNLISMHNQETDEENKFFRYKQGGFVELYNFLQQSIDFFKPQARDSIQTVIPLLDSNTPILLVHNTFTTTKDIYFIKRFGCNVTWCLCPKANLYIENRLPKIDVLQASGFDITIGTDSLASNSELSILSELKAVQSHFPHIPLNTLLAWATQNGAKFLGIDNQFGAIQVGKKPGLNLITKVSQDRLTTESKVKRLV